MSNGASRLTFLTKKIEPEEKMAPFIEVFIDRR